MNSPLKFAVACPTRSVCDHHARVFASLGRLQGHYLGTRRGAPGIPENFSHRLPLIGLASYAVARTFPAKGEAAKVACFPFFDTWVKQRLPENTHIFSSYGYVVETFRKARDIGGMTLLDGGNSHFSHYWKLVSEEHSRWGVDVDPFPRKWYERGLRSIELTDWVFSPSSYVTRSFVELGFPEERILYLPYPIDFSNFSPEPHLQLPASPLKVVCTGDVSLRKGFPYLLEAMRLIRKERDAILLLTEGVHKSMRSLLERYPDIPIDWTPRLGHDRLGERIKSGHVFALLSIEEGLARTALEALACGVPVVVTPNTGVSDFVIPGKNGEVVPIRDAHAAAEAIVRCHDRSMAGHHFADDALISSLSFGAFEKRLINHLKTIDSGTPHQI